ncbi:MAG TPA: hypothetical protein VJP81_04025 [Candidatus Dormibacteraeota bacterium]|nr:hypothetical protein [Candidatus Dormibacteraeota bacterium]
MTTKQISTEEVSLDSDLTTFSLNLLMAADLVVRLYRGLDRARVTPARSQPAIAALFEEPLPEEPQPMDVILEAVENDVFANSTLYLSPTSSDTSTAVEIRRQLWETSTLYQGRADAEAAPRSTE